MGVLALVLPGVREVRTPLVVGWLWIAIQPVQRVLLMITRLIVGLALIALALSIVLFLAPWIRSLLVLVVSVIVTAVVTGLVVYHYRVQRLLFESLVEVFQKLAGATLGYVENRLISLRARYRHVSVHDFYGMRRDIRLYIVGQIDQLTGTNAEALRSFIQAADAAVLARVSTRLLESADPTRTVEFDRYPPLNP